MNNELNDKRPQEFDADTIFRNRWSPRAMSGESINEDELMNLFEAARWAPSSFNSQPWRFVYAFRDDWTSLFDLLVDFNKSWVKRASALILVVSRKNFEHNEEFSRTHSFDAGAAWQNIALQASLQGLVCHGIGGFDHERAKEVANIPDEYNIEMMIAIGKPGNREDLSNGLKEREVPSPRKSISEIVFRNKMK